MAYNPLSKIKHDICGGGINVSLCYNIGSRASFTEWVDKICLIDKIYRKYFPLIFIALKLYLGLNITMMEHGFYNETFKSINCNYNIIWKISQMADNHTFGILLNKLIKSH